MLRLQIYKEICNMACFVGEKCCFSLLFCGNLLFERDDCAIVLLLSCCDCGKIE